MLKSPTFWEDEGEAALLKLNYGFLESQGDAVFELVAAWPEMLGVDVNGDFELPEAKAPSRIVLRDVERTFASEENCATLANVLTYMQERKNGEYGQGMGYAAGFLSLFFEPAIVAQMLVVLDEDEKYLKNYWLAEAVGFNIDAHVSARMIAQFFPDVVAHMHAKSVFHQSYLQKLYCGLGINMLPFSALVRSITAFMEQGFAYHFKFAMAQTMATGSMITSMGLTSDIFALLRCDTKFCDEAVCNQLVDAAIGLSVDDQFVPTIIGLRDVVWREEVKPAMDKAAAYAAAHADSDDGELSDMEEGVDCEICDMMIPEYYCAQSDLLVCGMCVEKSKKSSWDHPLLKADSVLTEDYDENLILAARAQAGAADRAGDGAGDGEGAGAGEGAGDGEGEDDGEVDALADALGAVAITEDGVVATE